MATLIVQDFSMVCDVKSDFGIAHRLDAMTSGVLLIAKTDVGYTHLRNAFTTHDIYKEYLCLVHGVVKEQTAEVALPIHWDQSRNVSSISAGGNWAKSIYSVKGWSWA